MKRLSTSPAWKAPASTGKKKLTDSWLVSLWPLEVTGREGTSIFLDGAICSQVFECIIKRFSQVKVRGNSLTFHSPQYHHTPQRYPHPMEEQPSTQCEQVPPKTQYAGVQVPSLLTTQFYPEIFPKSSSWKGFWRESASPPLLSLVNVHCVA